MYLFILLVYTVPALFLHDIWRKHLTTNNLMYLAQTHAPTTGLFWVEVH